jgi:hypothetical protein
MDQVSDSQVFKSEELHKEQNSRFKLHLPQKVSLILENISSNRKRLVPMLVIAAAIPVTVALALTQTNFFNRAAELPATPVTPPGVISYVLVPSESKVQMPISIPGTGYAVYGVLKDNYGNVVVNQTDFSYAWESNSTSIVSIVPFAGCVMGIQEPCPLDHATFTGIAYGTAIITETVKQISTNSVVASTTFSVTVAPSSSTITLTPTPTLKPTVPVCIPSTIAPETGYAPLVVTLYGGGQAGGVDSLVVGYQWDFTNDGVWDTSTSINPVKYTYKAAGTYYPKYRIQGSNKTWSATCNYKYPVIVQKPPTPTLTPVPKYTFHVNANAKVKVFTLKGSCISSYWTKYWVSSSSQAPASAVKAYKACGSGLGFSSYNTTYVTAGSFANSVVGVSASDGTSVTSP